VTVDAGRWRGEACFEKHTRPQAKALCSAYLSAFKHRGCELHGAREVCDIS